jgi:predicted nucleic acid-binding protein
VILLDACAAIALLEDEPAAEKVGELLRDGATLTTVGVAEVLDYLIRQSGSADDEAVLDVGTLGLLDPVLIDEFVATRAGVLRATHYHRVARSVSMADCIAAEAARWHDALLATSDPHLLDMCHAEGIAVLPLPDTRGTTWSSSV